MPTQTAGAYVPLSLAAQRAGLTWPQAWNAVLRGELRGRKRANRWEVEEASLDEWVARNAPAAA